MKLNFISSIFMGMKPSSGEINLLLCYSIKHFFILSAQFCTIAGLGKPMLGPDLKLQAAAEKQRELRLLKAYD